MISGQNPANKIVIFIADTLEFLGEFVASDGNNNIEYIKPLNDGRVWAFSGSTISVWESPVCISLHLYSSLIMI
jgi:hypothetical protein